MHTFLQFAFEADRSQGIHHKSSAYRSFLLELNR